MPYKSDAQRRYFNANRKKLEEQGVNVDEWNESSRGKELPEKVSSIALLAKQAVYQKYAYGVYDDDFIYDRYLDGGLSHKLSTKDIIADIKRMQQEAELNNARLAFSQHRYHRDPNTNETSEYDSAEAIRKVQQNLADESGPNYYAYTANSGPKGKPGSLANWKKLEEPKSLKAARFFTPADFLPPAELKKRQVKLRTK